MNRRVVNDWIYERYSLSRMCISPNSSNFVKDYFVSSTDPGKMGYHVLSWYPVVVSTSYHTLKFLLNPFAGGTVGECAYYISSTPC